MTQLTPRERRTSDKVSIGSNGKLYISAKQAKQLDWAEGWCVVTDNQNGTVTIEPAEESNSNAFRINRSNDRTRGMTLTCWRLADIFKVHVKRKLIPAHVAHGKLIIGGKA